MATYGWMINLSGKSLPVYAANGGAPSTTQIGNVTKNECFVDGTISENPWEGDGIPVVFLNSIHIMTFGLITDYDCTLVDFTDYASNGTSWVPVSTLERKVQYDTVAYYADGSKRCDLPAGSKVWLTSNGTAGQTNPNYIAVTSVETACFCYKKIKKLILKISFLLPISKISFLITYSIPLLPAHTS